MSTTHHDDRWRGASTLKTIETNDDCDAARRTNDAKWVVVGAKDALLENGAFARPATARQLSRDFKVLRLLKLFKIFRMLKILRVEGLLHDLCDQGWLTPAVARLCSVVFCVEFNHWFGWS